MLLQTAQWPGLIPFVGFLQCDKHCLGKLNIDAANVGLLTVLVPQRAKTGRQWKTLFASAVFSSSSPLIKPVLPHLHVLQTLSYVWCYLCSMEVQDLSSVNLREIPVMSCKITGYVAPLINILFK